MEQTNNLLLDGIVAESQGKADAILKDAQAQVERIEADAKKRAEEQVEVSERDHQSRMRQVQFRLDAALASAKRKAQLKRIDESYQMVMDRVVSRFRTFAQSKAFRPYLAQWIAEAAIGLDLKEAKVAFCPLAPVDEAMLKDAEALVKQVTGSTVHLVLDSRSVREIGVVLSSMDDKVSFNNQVDVRLRRYDRDIRTMVQEHTWNAE